VSHSLIDNLVKDKTYENAMLRTLGWKQSHVALISLQKTALFLVLPGCLFGLTLALVFTVFLKNVLEDQTMRTIELEFKMEAYLVGIFVSWVLPLMAMIAPVYNSLTVSLRDALDVFRPKTTSMTVAFSKLEDMYGLNVVELVVGLTFATLGVIIYVVIPFSFVSQSFDALGMIIVFIYTLTSFAMCLIARLILSSVSFHLSIFNCWFQRVVLRNKTATRLQPVLLNNMEAHSINNSKIGLTFICVVCFLM
jgi:hypothetical protein